MYVQNEEAIHCHLDSEVIWTRVSWSPSHPHGKCDSCVSGSGVAFCGLQQSRLEH